MSEVWKGEHATGVGFSTYKNRVDLSVEMANGFLPLDLHLYCKKDRVIIQFPDGRRVHLVRKLQNYQAKKRTRVTWARDHETDVPLSKGKR